MAKSYLRFKIYGKEQKEAISFVARAIVDCVFVFLKKIIGYFSNFLAITVILLSVISTSQSIVSPGFTFNTFTISFGNPTRNDLDLGFA